MTEKQDFCCNCRFLQIRRPRDGWLLTREGRQRQTFTACAKDLFCPWVFTLHNLMMQPGNGGCKEFEANPRLKRSRKENGGFLWSRDAKTTR